jgi:hypothetical protein
VCRYNPICGFSIVGRIGVRFCILRLDARPKLRNFGALTQTGLLRRVLFCRFELRSSSLALRLAIGGADFRAMHKDKPPGIFDLGDRSMRYAAGFCFVVGFLLSVLVRVAVALAGEHFSQATPWSGS